MEASASSARMRQLAAPGQLAEGEGPTDHEGVVALVVASHPGAVHTNAAGRGTQLLLSPNVSFQLSTPQFTLKPTKKMSLRL